MSTAHNVEGQQSDAPIVSKKVERVISISFLISFLATIALGVVFWQGGQPQLEGAFLCVGLLGIGVGVVSWGAYFAKTNDAGSITSLGFIRAQESTL